MDFSALQYILRLSPLFFLTLCCVDAFLVATSNINEPQLLGKFHYASAAFSALDKRSSGSGYDLILTSFGFSSDVSVVSDVGKFLSDVTKIAPVSISKTLKWPNEVSAVPVQALNGHYVAIPDGFLVPTKTDGSIKVYNLNNPGSPLVTLSSHTGEWFYHRVLWVDMNKDGRLDALTCRANKPLIGATKGELVWFTSPPSKSLATPWPESIVANGPDIYFNLAHFKVGTKTYEAIVVAEFFSHKIRVYWSEDYRQDWSNKTYVKSRDIDVSMGAPFDVVIADVNGDGHLDILATTNSEHNGTVLVYEVPVDFRTGQFKRHRLADGYASQSMGLNKGGPGSPYVIPAPAGQKPSILVAGDDAAVLSLLTPKAPQNHTNWEYTRTDFLKTGTSTVGGISFADVDGDGRLELFVPSYDEGYVYVYRL
ncbi:CAunnamed protein product [Biomphalaria glabrata]|nr:CAunnamed protein product [Biomphalaria glabrata]